LGLSFNTKFAYGIGQSAEGLMHGAFATFLLFYYNQVIGISGTLAGFAVGTAVLIDAITDPLVGSVSDNWRSRLGRRHPFMFASIVPLALSFVLLFNPLVSSEWALFVWLVVFTNLTRTAMTFFSVPHNALGAEMTTHFEERSTVVGYRVFFGNVGALAAVYVGFWLFFVPTPEFENGQLNAAAYGPFALTVAVLMALTIAWCAAGTRSLSPNLPAPLDTAPVRLGGALVRMVRELVGALQCGGFRWLFCGVLLVSIMIGVDGALSIYIFTYFWEFGRGDILAISPAYPIGAALGALAGGYLTRRFGKKWSLIFGGLAWPICQVLPITLRLVGWFPENPDPMLLPLLIGIRAVQGACTVQALVAFGSMIADTADEHEFHTGRRQAGIFFAASSFSSKAASGAGTVLAGLGLDLIAWPRGTGVRTAADVPPETIVHLGLVYGPVIGAFGMMSVLFYMRYRLTRERHAEILAELSRRRRAHSAPAVAERARLYGAPAGSASRAG
jgi:glycoside/pentoside/hexuronide:cation symporter, GPH family